MACCQNPTLSSLPCPFNQIGLFGLGCSLGAHTSSQNRMPPVFRKPRGRYAGTLDPLNRGSLRTSLFGLRPPRAEHPQRRQCSRVATLISAQFRLRLPKHPPRGVAPWIDARRQAGAGQGSVHDIRERLALGHHGRSAPPERNADLRGLACPAALGMGRVVALEKLLRPALNAVQNPRRPHQMDMRLRRSIHRRRLMNGP